LRRLCLALFLTMACGLAPGGVRAADDTPVASLADGRSGKIFFESVTPTGYFQLVRREATTEAVIFATLLLPPASAGKVPAMVVSHGSGGVSEGREHWWARELVKQGIAATVVDSFTPRTSRARPPPIFGIVSRAAERWEGTARPVGGRRRT